MVNRKVKKVLRGSRYQYESGLVMVNRIAEINAGECWHKKIPPAPEGGDRGEGVKRQRSSGCFFLSFNPHTPNRCDNWHYTAKEVNNS